MLPRWGFLILGIFAWCIYVNAASAKQINCQRYVFHPNCRGSQAKKRFINVADYETGDPSACICPTSKKIANNAIAALSTTKLLEALFDKGFDVNTIYDAYMATSDRRRDYSLNNRDRSSQRRKSQQLDSSIDFANSDLDEDY